MCARRPDEIAGLVALMEPGLLKRELESRGLVLLAVARHRSDPEVLVVYLHGNEGQWVDGRARRRTASVPGVVAVIESVQSPTILFVRVESSEDGHPEPGPSG
jgi:hypothetical protein